MDTFQPFVISVFLRKANKFISDVWLGWDESCISGLGNFKNDRVYWRICRVLFGQTILTAGNDFSQSG